MNEQEQNQKPKESVIELIQKCLALANSPNEHEASLAMEKAQELLLKYNLSMMDVEESKRPDESQLIDATVPDMEGSSTKRIMFNVVAKYNFCHVIGHPNNTISILGRMSNVNATYEMANWLWIQIERLSITEMRNYKSWTIIDGQAYKNRESKQSYRRGYEMGIITRIKNKLEESRKTQEVSYANTTSLIVRLDKETSIFVQQQYPKLVNLGVKSYGKSGYSKGYQDGAGVSLSSSSHLNGGYLRLS